MKLLMVNTYAKTVLDGVELPTGVTNLDTYSIAKMTRRSASCTIHSS